MINIRGNDQLLTLGKYSKPMTEINISKINIIVISSQVSTYVTCYGQYHAWTIINCTKRCCQLICGHHCFKMIREFLGLVFVTSLLVPSGTKGLSCPGGEKGPGGNCLCSQALGKDQGQWGDPFCHQGLCIIQQLTSGDHCKAKPMGLHGLKDGTWCWNKKRQTACPTGNNYIFVTEFVFSSPWWNEISVMKIF